jgi:L,D-transpeptidase catalytic domain
MRLRRRPLTTLAVGLALAAPVLLGASCAAASRPAHAVAARTSKSTLLARWRAFAYWGHPVGAYRVHREPSSRSPVVTVLHQRTEDGYPEVYLVLQRLVTRGGGKWLKIALPMRPNGTTGWVVSRAFRRLHGVRRWLVIDRTRLFARFFMDGKPIWTAPVGIGKPSTPTPSGLFWVREEFALPDQPFYGPYAFGTSAYASISEWPGGGVVGLHGTSEPYLIPGRPSHGCIRFRNGDILWLAQHMPLGTPVAIIR